MNKETSITGFLDLPWDVTASQRDVKSTTVSRVKFINTTIFFTNGRYYVFSNFPQVDYSIPFSSSFLRIELMGLKSGPVVRKLARSDFSGESFLNFM